MSVQRHLPAKIWLEIARWGYVPPPQAFLRSTEPPTAPHEYPSVYESVSGRDLLWLHTVSSLSRVNRHLRAIFQGECPRDCLVVTEADAHERSLQLAKVPITNRSSIPVRHLMEAHIQIQLATFIPISPPSCACYLNSPSYRSLF
ncbi:hypothetical protein PENSPDRAFT_92697 [Peniophora sp. CONT]|nr:hypothetical protein PENSPDRAFT_92697 [Peniophora sp. CONT]